ncbi:MAG: hypothetical protein JWQ39_2739 [Glaciihabitans sp.]|jgi:hypothetical protein|nr:hypothetical protein [Glaciihabitans sp.]
MVLGIVGVVFSLFYGLGLFPAIAAVITGHIASRKQKHAKAFWLTGIITGYAGLAICLIVIVVVAALIVFATNSVNSYGYNNLGQP